MPRQNHSIDDLTELSDEHVSLPILQTHQIWQGHIVSVHEETVELRPGIQPVTRQFVRHPGAVAIVALRGAAGEEEILLERQYRHPIRAHLWEIPAGLLDVDGEDYLSAAQRELAEETDLKAGRWNVLADYFNSPGGYTESLRIFLAQDLSFSGQVFERVDEERDMVTVWMPLEDAVTAVLEGRFHNPSTVVGVLAAHTARERGWADLRPADAPWFR